MANTARDLIKCSISNAPGTTGGFTLAAAAANSLMPGAGDDGLKFKLNITQNGVGTEIRKDCTYTHSSTSFSRGTMVRSTGTADAALNFTSAAIVRVVPSAEDYRSADPGGQLVVAIGDSLQGDGVTTGSLGFSTLAKSGINWGCALLKQALWMPVGVTSSYSSGAPDLVNYCLAASGSTAQDVIEDQLGPAQALKADWWSVQCGTNDLTLLAGSTVAQIAARLRTICETGLSSGSKIALWTIVPRNGAQWTAIESTITGAGSTIAKQKLKHMAVNNWIRRYAQETPGVVLIDPYHELVDPASAAGEWLALERRGRVCRWAGIRYRNAAVRQACFPEQRQPARHLRCDGQHQRRLRGNERVAGFYRSFWHWNEWHMADRLDSWHGERRGYMRRRCASENRYRCNRRACKRQRTRACHIDCRRRFTLARLSSSDRRGDPRQYAVLC